MDIMENKTETTLVYGDYMGIHPAAYGGVRHSEFLFSCLMHLRQGIGEATVPQSEAWAPAITNLQCLVCWSCARGSYEAVPACYAEEQQLPAELPLGHVRTGSGYDVSSCLFPWMIE